MKPLQQSSDCACAGEGKQVMHIGDPHAADREVRQIDSPTSSADETDIVAPPPAHWSKPGNMVSPHNEMRSTWEMQMCAMGVIHDGSSPDHMGISLPRYLIPCL